MAGVLLSPIWLRNGLGTVQVFPVQVLPYSKNTAGKSDTDVKRHAACWHASLNPATTKVCATTSVPLRDPRSIHVVSPLKAFMGVTVNTKRHSTS